MEPPPFVQHFKAFWRYRVRILAIQYGARSRSRYMAVIGPGGGAPDGWNGTIEEAYVGARHSRAKAV